MTARAAVVAYLRRARQGDCLAIEGEDLILVSDGGGAWCWSIRGTFFKYLEGKARHPNDCPRGYVDASGNVL